MHMAASGQGGSMHMMEDGGSVFPGHTHSRQQSPQHSHHSHSHAPSASASAAPQTVTVPLRPVSSGGVRPLGRQWKLPQQFEHTMARIGGSLEAQAALTRAVEVQEHVGLHAFRSCLSLPGPHLLAFSRQQSTLFRQRKCLVDDRLSIPPTFVTDKEQIAVQNAVKLHALMSQSHVSHGSHQSHGSHGMSGMSGDSEGAGAEAGGHHTQHTEHTQHTQHTQHIQHRGRGHEEGTEGSEGTSSVERLAVQTDLDLHDLTPQHSLHSLQMASMASQVGVICHVIELDKIRLFDFYSLCQGPNLVF
jgi:hypothetical protein